MASDSKTGSTTSTHSEAKPPRSSLMISGLVGLATMCLVTTILHAIIDSFASYPMKGPGAEFKALLLGMAIPCLIVIWFLSALRWVERLNDISSILCGRSLIVGLAAASFGVLYALSQIPSPTLQIYVAFSLWPAYSGLLIGALLP